MTKDDNRLAKFQSIMAMLSKWPEDKVKTILKERLEKEGWSITQASMGSQQGKDLEANKNNKIIHIDNPISYQRVAHNYPYHIQMEYKKITITLPENLFTEYKKFTGENGLNMSGRIAILIKQDLKNKVLE